MDHNIAMKHIMAMNHMMLLYITTEQGLALNILAIALQLTDKELIVVNKLAIKSFAEVIVNMFNIVNHLLKLLVANYIKLKAKYIKQILVKRLRFG